MLTMLHNELKKLIPLRRLGVYYYITVMLIILSSYFLIPFSIQLISLIFFCFYMQLMARHFLLLRKNPFYEFPPEEVDETARLLTKSTDGKFVLREIHVAQSLVREEVLKKYGWTDDDYHNAIMDQYKK